MSSYCDAVAKKVNAILGYLGKYQGEAITNTNSKYYKNGPGSRNNALRWGAKKISLGLFVCLIEGKVRTWLKHGL